MFVEADLTHIEPRQGRHKLSARPCAAPTELEDRSDCSATNMSLLSELRISLRPIRNGRRINHMLIKTSLSLTTLILSAIFFSASVFAQQMVLVDGNPPLTQSDFESIAEY